MAWTKLTITNITDNENIVSLRADWVLLEDKFTFIEPRVNTADENEKIAFVENAKLALEKWQKDKLPKQLESDLLTLLNK